jgi:hypothetical protein
MTAATTMIVRNITRTSRATIAISVVVSARADLADGPWAVEILLGESIARSSALVTEVEAGPAEGLAGDLHGPSATVAVVPSALGRR